MLFETLTSFLKRRYVFSFIHINCLGILACEKIMIFMQSIKNFKAKKTNSNIQTCFIFRWAGPRKGEIQGHLWRTRPDLRRDVRLLNHFYQILYKSISQFFFLRKKTQNVFEICLPSKSRILQHYFFVRFFPLPQTFPLLLEKETKSFSSVTVVFGCDDIFLCEIFASILTI